MLRVREILELKGLIESSKKILILSGAGVSTLSGVKDFKTFDKELNECGEISREELLNIRYFKEDPSRFWEGYMKYFNKGDLDEFIPNEVHKYIQGLENSKEVVVATQNIDGLHQKSGSSRVVELHGSYKDLVCIGCGKEYKSSNFKEGLKEGVIPICKEGCGRVLKPGIILFGEEVSGYNEVIKDIKESDLMIVLGTRLEVYPVTKIVDGFLKRKKVEAKYKGGTKKRLVIWNKDKTLYDNKANIVINEDLNKINELAK